MNTLNDLRSTLDAHAADIHDDASRARVVAVHGRARAVRRRRAVGVAAAAVAVVAVTAVPRMLGDAEPAPTDRELIGKVAPATLTSLGYTYDFVEGVEDDRIKLDASDEPRLLTWAVAGGPEDVLVDSRYSEGEVWSEGTDFDDFLVIHPGERGPWQVRGSGGAEVAMAVYELTDARPAGYTVDGITFREQIGPETLVDAVIGDVGDTDLTLDITMPEGGIRIAELCQSVPRGYWANVEVEQQGALSSGGCSGDPVLDAGVGNGSTSPGYDFEPGSSVQIRIWVSRDTEGPVVEMPDVRLGLAVYKTAPPAVTLAGWDLPLRYEYDGHLWELAAADGESAGGLDASTPEEARLALVASRFDSQSRYRVRVAGELQGIHSSPRGSLDEVPVRSGEDVQVVVGGDGSGAEFGIAFYRRVD